MVLNEYFEKESGWCKSHLEVNFKPETVINRSIVMLCLLSQEGTVKWDVKFGDYSAQEYCRVVNNLLKSTKTGDKSLVITN